MKGKIKFSKPNKFTIKINSCGINTCNATFDKMGIIKATIFSIIFIICMFGFMYWVLDEEDKVTRCIAENKGEPCLNEKCWAENSFPNFRARDRYKICLLEEINNG